MELVKKTMLMSVVGDDEVWKCFICVCRAANDGKSYPKLAERTCHCSCQGTLGRHFITAHLDFMSPDDSFECPLCFCTLIHKKHLQNHAQRVHGIKTNIKFKRPPLRGTVPTAWSVPA